MGFKTKFKKLETTVDESEMFFNPNFTGMVLNISKEDRYVNFELPIAIQLTQGDKILFYNCKIKKGNQCWYVDNKGYSAVEIYYGKNKNVNVRLGGDQADCLERLERRKLRKENKN